MISTEDLANRFTYHAPHGDQGDRYEHIRDAGGELADTINRLCPDSREKSLAVTKIEEAVMWANAAIARNEHKTDTVNLDRYEAPAEGDDAGELHRVSPDVSA